jgi:hypothetical protein
MSSNSALAEPIAVERQPVDLGPWCELDPDDSVARLEAQYAMRFGPTSYTDAQSAFIDEVISRRKDLDEPPLPIED